MKPYNKANIKLAKNLRQNMTKYERMLWYDFLSKYPVRFQRQKAIGNFIVDFYCAKAALIIEVDGGGHFTENGLAEDAKRTKLLESLGLSVLRVSNADISINFSGVCQIIEYEVERRRAQVSESR
jgi:very-short-patch-repair endonuclease